MIYKFQKTTPARGYVTLERKCFKDREYFSPDSHIFNFEENKNMVWI